MKMGVGLMLVSFGTFWSAEGVHVSWPGSDLAIPVLVACYGLVAWLLVGVTRTAGRRRGGPGAGAGSRPVADAGPRTTSAAARGGWPRSAGSGGSS